MADVLSQSQIDALLNNLTSGDVDIEEIAADEGAEGVKEYDLTSPKKVTRENLKLISSIYESYSRIISSYFSAILRLFSEVEVEQTEESIFYEYSNALSDSVLMCIVDFKLPDTRKTCGQVLINVSKSLAFCIIDKLLGGTGDDYNYDRDFTEIELSILDNLLRQMVTMMQSAWQGTIPIAIEFNKIETNARFIQEINYNDTVLLLVLNSVIKDLSGKITVCIPTMTLDEIFKKAESIKASQKEHDGHEEEKRNEIMNYLKTSDLDVKGVLGKTDLTLGEVLDIHLGDVLVLDETVDSDLVLTVENKEWFKGKWGVKKNKNAIKINDILV